MGEQVVRNAGIGRQLPRLATVAGLAAEKVVPITAVFRDAVAADKVLGLHRTTERAVRAGYLADDEAQELLRHITTEAFFASATLFILVATAN